MNKSYNKNVETVTGKQTKSAKWLCGIMLGLLLAGMGFTPAEGKAPSASSDDIRVKITTQREGDVTHFYVENLERTEITMTFNLGLENLKSTKRLPLTATFAPNRKVEAFNLSPVDTEQPWQYSFTNYYNIGSSDAVHDDNYLYSLPYAAGSTFRVSQGYDGNFSHTGSCKYSTDWKMPEGTPVHAARGGVIVKVKDDSDRGGGSLDFDCYNNYVLIRHEDGTLGHYCHLQKNGVQVREGDVVNTGDPIALSGNTGFSSGPHLHFSVYKTKNGRERESIPVKFKTAEAAGAITLKTGDRYTAPRTVAQDGSPAQRVSPAGG